MRDEPAAAVTNGRRPLPHFEERPYKWSQRWFDDPTVGTIAGPDIYVGNGDWEPLDDGLASFSNSRSCR